MEEVIIVGAGPCGLSAAVELKKRGIEPLLIEKGCVVNSIYEYPTFLQFFSTPELLEIGEMPFHTVHEKPTRQEALAYYRTVALRSGLRIRTYEAVESLVPGECFEIAARDRYGAVHRYRSRYAIIATGYFDNPNKLHVPGEELPKVSGKYREPHPYMGQDVAIVGGNNSAVDAALDLERTGARVSVIYRGADYSANIKPWVRPIIESRVNKGRIAMYFNSHVKEIKPRSIVFAAAGERMEIANDFVLALIGYRPDRGMLAAIGVEVDEQTHAPVHDEATFETNVPNLFVAGVIAAGKEANEIFIENGRLHGAAIACEIARREGR